jgi:hypothetical protein
MNGAKNKKTTRLSGFLPTEVVRTEKNNRIKSNSNRIKTIPD